jgi:hypothetical protein
MCKKTQWSRIWIALTAAMLIGCKAAPAPSVGFADASVMKNDPSVPYNRFWRKPGLDLTNYNKIYIAEVNTSYMLKMTDWQKGERRTDIERDVKTLADYTRNSMIKAINSEPSHRFHVIDSPTHDPQALVCEVALVEVVPSKVVLNALGYAPFFIGTGISVVRTVASDKSSVAFEARTRDAATGEIVMLAADREAEQFAPVDLRGLTWYSDAEGIIDEWSRQLVLVVKAKPGEKVSGSPTFRLLPW